MDDGKVNLESGFFHKLASFIVDRHNLFFLFFALACIFSVFSAGWVEVEDDITKYLAKNTETRQGVELMDKEFDTFATAEIMISNISYERALKVADMLENIGGIYSVDFENDSEHVNGASALFFLNFDSDTDSKKSELTLQKITSALKNYDAYISTQIGQSSVKSLAKDMKLIICIAAIIIFSVLLFTSHSYAEIPVLMITFVVAAILNKGTNFLLGKISYISDSVAVALQLALAIDYAIILCHRFIEERKTKIARDAAVTALSKSIIEIFSSSLTTISGLLALMIMHFKIGQDLSIVLIKAIFLSLLSVFALMPGLLVVFSKFMERTVHKNFVPEINLLGKAVIKTKYIMPVVFVIVIAISFYFSNLCPYCYGKNELSTFHKSYEQITRDKIKSTFKKTNPIALIVPAGDYKKEKKLLDELKGYSQVDETIGLANTKAIDDYTLTDELSPRQFSELVDMDYQTAKILYSSYAIENKYYGRLLNNISNYKLHLIDVLEFLYQKTSDNQLDLEQSLLDDINDAHKKIIRAKSQLQSENYSRMIVELNLSEEGPETFAFLGKLHDVIRKYYPNNFYVVGNPTSDYDLSSSFSIDNILISILSALFVILVLIFTFMSVGLPLLLILVIQGSIWINFSFPFLMNSKLFFLAYLVVNSIQMGANIDYAIVISNRYSELKRKMPIDKAIVTALNQSFPTIITSGTILAAAGWLIGLISTDGAISAVGICLGRGTLISIALVMCVLPQILLFGDTIIEKTRFKIDKPDIVKKSTGTIFLNGRMRGYISGLIDANIHGIINGKVNAIIDSADMKKIDEENFLSDDVLTDITDDMDENNNENG